MRWRAGTTSTTAGPPATERPALTAAQRAAIASIRRHARGRAVAARRAIDDALARAGVAARGVVAALRRRLGTAPVHVHFHPERLTRAGDTVVEGLLRDGAFRTQFETGISSGSPTAFAGGDRDEWERVFFEGAYHRRTARPGDRPRYGAVDLAGHPDGAAPRFGACYLVLRPGLNARCTFTWLGSQEAGARDRAGTVDAPASVLEAIVAAVERERTAFGLAELDVAGLARLLAAPPVPRAPPGRALDSFIEAQIHGAIRLDADVARVVGDPSHRGTAAGAHLEELARRHALPLAWHGGYALPSARFPETFRDYRTRDLAERIAPGGRLDAATLGRAENAFVREPAAWGAWGTRDELLTRFRRLWHVLVLHGEPVREA